MSTRVYSYKRCSTCTKALKWLDARGVDVELVPIVDSPPDAKTLEKLIERSGLPIKRFFNTSGVSYREGGFSAKLKTMTKAQAVAALAADGKLIKRPLVDAEAAVLVGFKEPEYAAVWGADA